MNEPAIEVDDADGGDLLRLAGGDARVTIGCRTNRTRNASLRTCWARTSEMYRYLFREDSIWVQTRATGDVGVPEGLTRT